VLCVHNAQVGRPCTLTSEQDAQLLAERLTGKKIADVKA